MGGLGGAAGVALGASAWARTRPAAPSGSQSALAFGISLAQWSLHRALRGGELDALEFPRVARAEFGLGAVEYVNSFFKERATDFEWLGELRRRARDQGVESLLIMVDGEGALGDPDETRRRRALERHFKWIAAARFLGCHAVRVNAAGEGDAAEVSARVADSLHRLGELGEEYALDVIVENHGGLSSNGAWLARTLAAADHSRVGSLPDFGNFDLGGGERYDRYQGVRELMPFARAVSAKSHDFDAAGNEVHTDYRRMLRIVLEAGYRGFIGIEYEGERLPEPEGIAATQSLLRRVREELAPEFGR